jgi:FecR protein
MSARRFAGAIVLAAVSLGAAVSAGIAVAQSELPLKAVTVAGKSEIYRQSTSKWGEAALRAELGPGDGARTLTASRLTLRTKSGQSLRLGARSRLTVLAPTGAGDQPTRVKLESGALWVAVTPGGPAAESVVVETAAAVVTVGGSGVWITHTPDGAVQIRVFHGTAECTGPGAKREWTRLVAADRDMTVSAAGAPAPIKKLEPDKLQSDWVKWNEEQDVAGGYGAKPAQP